MAPRSRVAFALTGLLASTVLVLPAGCATDLPAAAVVTVQEAPTPVRAAPPVPVAQAAPVLKAPVDPLVALVTEIEDQVFAAANAARAEAGLAPLERLTELDAVARGWSTMLATEGSDLAHNPDYSEQIPQGWSLAGENAAWTGETRVVPADEIAGPMHQGWMDSPGHRENILNPEYTHLGVGVAYSPEHGYYLIQNFASY